MGEWHRTPFGVHPLRDAIMQREATRWVELELARLAHSGSIGVAKISSEHGPIIKAAFEAGARFEVERLSRSTGVSFRALPQKVIKDGATVWFSNVRRAPGMNVCSETVWRHLLLNSFSYGADFVSDFLWPKQPRLNRKVKRR